MTAKSEHPRLERVVVWVATVALITALGLIAYDVFKRIATLT